MKVIFRTIKINKSRVGCVTPRLNYNTIGFVFIKKSICFLRNGERSVIGMIRGEMWPGGAGFMKNTPLRRRGPKVDSSKLTIREVIGILKLVLDMVLPYMRDHSLVR